MALVKCPECGSEGISDTAVTCPKCGAAIKAYYDKVRYEEQVIEYKRQRAPYIQMPPCPKKPIAITISSILLFVISTFPLIGVLAELLFRRPDGFKMLVLFLLASLLIGFGVCFLVSGWNKYKRAKTNYDYATNNHAAYIDTCLDEEIKRAQYAQALRCPVCGSNKVWRISTGDRVASVYMVGLASSTIGKQYQCSSCGHKW